MRQLIGQAVLIGLLSAAGSAGAAPEMRCRLDGAYIKVHGKSEAEQREVCDRQGGEYTRYVPPEARAGSNPREQAMKSIFGRNGGGSRY